MTYVGDQFENITSIHLKQNQIIQIRPCSLNIHTLIIF